MAACSCRPSFNRTSSSSSSSRSLPRTSTSNSSSNLVPVTKTTFLSFRIHRPQPINNNQVPYLQQQQHSPLSSHSFFSSRLFKCSSSQFHFSSPQNHNNDVSNNNCSGSSGGCGGGGGGDGWREWWSNDDDDDEFSSNSFTSCLLFLMSRIHCDDEIFSNRKGLVLILSVVLGFIVHHFGLSLYPALARTEDSEIRTEEEESVWEVRGGKWIKFVPDYVRDAFVVKPSGSETLSASLSIGELWSKCKEICMRLMLPEGYPDSVTSDYLDYSLWRGVQGVASQISGVLATQALLYAVGLGKGVIPTAAAINWVLKDGIGYLSKILLSKYGRHFDVHPKGWRLFADLLENAAFGLEMIIPVFPHLFVLIGATAGAGRSAAALIQAATRSCFYAGFAAQRNFAEVIAKGEAQGMVSKSIGIALGIALANYVGSSTSLSLVCFVVITWVHMYCNLKSYQAIQLRTFNPYRGSLVFSEYLLSGQVPPVKEVNDEEPLFPAVPFLNEKPESTVQSEVLSADAKDAAAEIDKRLQLGAKLSTVVSNKEDALALFDLYKNEGYILVEHKDKYCVILKENCSQQDMLKSLFQTNYLYWLETNAGIKMNNIYDDCRPGGRLQVSLDYVLREFNHVKYDWELAGWAADGLIARPLPNRIRT